MSFGSMLSPSIEARFGKVNGSWGNEDSLFTASSELKEMPWRGLEWMYRESGGGWGVDSGESEMRCYCRGEQHANHLSSTL